MPLSSNELKIYRIYALVDPVNGAARYVGQTAGTLGERRMDHVRRPGNSKKGQWIRTLLADDLEPRIVLLEQITDYRDQAYRLETHWIRRLRAEGHELLNVP